MALPDPPRGESNPGWPVRPPAGQDLLQCPTCGKRWHPQNFIYNSRGKIVGCGECRGSGRK